MCVLLSVKPSFIAEHEKILQEEREQSQKAIMEHKQQIESLEGMLYQRAKPKDIISLYTIVAEYERMLKQEREQHEKVTAEHLEKIKSLEGKYVH